MSVSIIDGVIEEVVLYPRRGRKGAFKSIRFRLDDGSERTEKGVMTAPPISDEIEPGTRGRFYLFQAAGSRGIHGMRKPDGTTLYAFPDNERKLAMFATMLAVCYLAYHLVAGELIGWGVIAAALGGAAWFYLTKARKEAKARFDGDAGHKPAPAAA
jgi:hypothetical protein